MIDPREVEDRSFAFAVTVVGFVREFGKNMPEGVLVPLLEKGTEIGAAVASAKSSHSRRYYLNKMMHARRASQEVDYWLRLAGAAGIAPFEFVKPMRAEARALLTVLTDICANAQQQLDAEKSGE